MDKKAKKEKKNELNILAKNSWRWRHPIESLKNLKRTLRWSWQRITKGYCDYDRWDIDLYLVELLPGLLEEFAEKTYSYPHSFESLEKWKSYLRGIAGGFRSAHRYHEQCDDLDGSREERKKALSHSRFCVKLAMKKLAEHYWDLWD